LWGRLVKPRYPSSQQQQQEAVMENIHAAHKENSSGWFSAVAGMAARIKRQPAVRSRGLVVTPWSGRSPAGWSA
jgi:hypothetical protein